MCQHVPLHRMPQRRQKLVQSEPGRTCIRGAHEPSCCFKAVLITSGRSMMGVVTSNALSSCLMCNGLSHASESLSNWHCSLLLISWDSKPAANCSAEP